MVLTGQAAMEKVVASDVKHTGSLPLLLSRKLTKLVFPSRLRKLHKWILHLAVSSLLLSCPRLKTLLHWLLRESAKWPALVAVPEQWSYQRRGCWFPRHCWKLVNICLFPCKVLCLDLITDRVSICHTGAPIVWWCDFTWLAASKKTAISGLGTDLPLSLCISFPLN